MFPSQKRKLCLEEAVQKKNDKVFELGCPERCHNHCFNFNCFRLHLNDLGCLPLKKIEVVFHLEEN